MQISLAKVKYLILDEADRMLDMGFLPSMMELVNKMGMPGKSDRQTLMFSATFPEEIQRLACELLGDYIFVTVGRVGGANIDIEQRVILVDQMKKRDQLVSILNEQGLYCFIRTRSVLFHIRIHQNTTISYLVDVSASDKKPKRQQSKNWLCFD